MRHLAAWRAGPHRDGAVVTFGRHSPVVFVAGPIDVVEDWIRRQCPWMFDPSTRDRLLRELPTKDAT